MRDSPSVERFRATDAVPIQAVLPVSVCRGKRAVPPRLSHDLTPALPLALIHCTMTTAAKSQGIPHASMDTTCNKKYNALQPDKHREFTDPTTVFLSKATD